MKTSGWKLTWLFWMDGSALPSLTSAQVWVPRMLAPAPPPHHLCGYFISPVASVSLIHLCSHRLAIACPGPTLSQAGPCFLQGGCCSVRTNNAKPGDMSSDKIPATPPVPVSISC